MQERGPLALVPPAVNCAADRVVAKAVPDMAVARTMGRGQGPESVGVADRCRAPRFFRSK